MAAGMALRSSAVAFEDAALGAEIVLRVDHDQRGVLGIDDLLQFREDDLVIEMDHGFGSFWLTQKEGSFLKKRSKKLVN